MSALGEISQNAGFYHQNYAATRAALSRCRALASPGPASSPPPKREDLKQAAEKALSALQILPAPMPSLSGAMAELEKSLRKPEAAKANADILSALRNLETAFQDQSNAYWQTLTHVLTGDREASINGISGGLSGGIKAPARDPGITDEMRRELEPCGDLESFARILEKHTLTIYAQDIANYRAAPHLADLSYFAKDTGLAAKARELILDGQFASMAQTLFPSQTPEHALGKSLEIAFGLEEAKDIDQACEAIRRGALLVHSHTIIANMKIWWKNRKPEEFAELRYVPAVQRCLLRLADLERVGLVTANNRFKTDLDRAGLDAESLHKKLKDAEVTIETASQTQAQLEEKARSAQEQIEELTKREGQLQRDLQDATRLRDARELSPNPSTQIRLTELELQVTALQKSLGILGKHDSEVAQERDDLRIVLSLSNQRETIAVARSLAQAQPHRAAFDRALADLEIAIARSKPILLRSNVEIDLAGRELSEGRLDEIKEFHQKATGMLEALPEQDGNVCRRMVELQVSIARMETKIAELNLKAEKVEGLDRLVRTARSEADKLRADLARQPQFVVRSGTTCLLPEDGELTIGTSGIIRLEPSLTNVANLHAKIKINRPTPPFRPEASCEILPRKGNDCTTFVNGQRAQKATSVKPGDRIVLGELKADPAQDAVLLVGREGSRFTLTLVEGRYRLVSDTESEAYFRGHKEALTALYEEMGSKVAKAFAQLTVNFPDVTLTPESVLESKKKGEEKHAINTGLTAYKEIIRNLTGPESALDLEARTDMDLIIVGPNREFVLTGDEIDIRRDSLLSEYTEAFEVIFHNNEAAKKTTAGKMAVLNVNLAYMGATIGFLKPDAVVDLIHNNQNNFRNALQTFGSPIHPDKHTTSAKLHDEAYKVFNGLCDQLKLALPDDKSFAAFSKRAEPYYESLRAKEERLKTAKGGSGSVGNAPPASDHAAAAAGGEAARPAPGGQARAEEPRDADPTVTAQKKPQGLVYALTPDRHVYTIGRSGTPELHADIQVSEFSLLVSRQQARLRKEGDRRVIVDIGVNANIVKVNNELLRGRTHFLDNGDVIEIERILFLVGQSGQTLTQIPLIRNANDENRGKAPKLDGGKLIFGDAKMMVVRANSSTGSVRRTPAGEWTFSVKTNAALPDEELAYIWQNEGSHHLFVRRGAEGIPFKVQGASKKPGDIVRLTAGNALQIGDLSFRFAV